MAVGAARFVGGPPGVAPLLLLFHGYAGRDLAAAIHETLRAQFPNPEMPRIASVVDLNYVPSFMHAPAKLALETAYHGAARKLPVGRDPADYVLLLPDWDGKLTQKFGMTDRADAVGIVLIDRQWEIVACHAGPDILADVQTMTQAISSMQTAPD